MRRYGFLQKEEIFEALNRLRDAFLAAKNGEEVEEIINGLLTHDEKMKIGRRILIAKYIKDGMGFGEIARALKVGKNTIVSVIHNLDRYPSAYELIEKRGKKVEKEYSNKNTKTIGGSKLIFKKKVHTGFRRKDVER